MFLYANFQRKIHPNGGWKGIPTQVKIAELFHCSSKVFCMKFSIDFRVCLLSSVFLTGCAVGPVQLMEESPAVVHTSDKPSKEVAKCIDKNWESPMKFLLVPPSNFVDMKETDTGFRITQKFDDRLYFVALISDRPGGSRTKVWSQKAIGLQKFLDDVVRCQ